MSKSDFQEDGKYLQFLLPYPAGDVSPVASDSGDSGAQCGASWLKEGTTRCSVSLDAVCTSPGGDLLEGNPCVE